MEEILQKILDRLDSMDNRFDSMENRFDSMDNRFDSMDNRFDNMDNRFDSMDNRFDSMENRIDSMENRMDSMEAGQQAMRQDMNGIHLKIEELTDQVTHVSEHLITFEHTFDRQMKAVSDTQMVALERWNKSNDLMERVETLLNDKESERVAVEAQLIDHETRITAIEQAS